MGTLLEGRRLVIAYAVWMPLMILAIVVAIAASSAQIAEIFEIPFPECVGPSCGPFGFTPRDIEVIAQLGIPNEIGYVYRILGSNFPGLLLALGVLGLVLWRRRNDWLAMLIAFVLVVMTGTFATDGGTALLEVDGWRLPLTIVQSLGIAALSVLLYTFPNGRFVPRWVMPIVGLLIVALLTIALTFDLTNPASHIADDVIMPVLLVSGIVAQIYRYFRVSDSVQRQQTKWLLLGMALPVILLIVWMVFTVAFLESYGPARVYFILGFAPLLMVVGLMFPLSVIIAVMRYRLWDIGIVVNRTLVYSALTFTLGIAYIGGILLIQWALQGITDQGGSVAIVVSTLGIAALFQPLRRHTQSAIDQRFYRGKYDAVKTLAAFSLRMRDEVNLDKIRGETIGVVTQTIQPSHVALWLRESPSGSGNRRGVM